MTLISAKELTKFYGDVHALDGLTLDIEPTFEVAQWVRLHVALDEVADRLDDVFGAAYSVSVFTDWASGSKNRFSAAVKICFVR